MILITGATGTVGSTLVEQLVADGQPVRALVRDPEKAAKSLPTEAELFRGDLLDAESMEEALQGVERMFLLSPPSQRMLDMEASAIAAARAAGLKHLVKLSVVNADPDSPSFFLSEHGKSEAAARESGVPVTFVRATFFMQNLLGLAGPIKAKGAIFQPAGNVAASYIDVRDIAAVAAKALTTAGHEGQTYMVTGPEAFTQAQIADLVSRVIGKPVKYVDVPRDAAKKAMLGSGMPEWQAEAISQLMDDVRAGKLAIVTGEVQRVTGKPPRTLEQFVQENRAAFLG
jgi:uncharacterized protein YbjT (DUF2867 family)